MNKLSFYDGNIKNTKHAKIIDIGEFVNYVKYATYKHVSDKIAAIEDKATRQKYKAEHLPYITTSGVFSERANAGLLEHSGLISIDIDGVENMAEVRDLLQSDPHTFILFKSVSGCGLCVVVKVTAKAENHLDHFRWLSQYYYDQYSIVIDESCKDVARARFVSFDPDIFVNEKSKLAGKKVTPKTQPKKINWIATEDQMSRIVSELYSNHLNIAESYQDYLTCAFAIADGYGEQGRQYFHAVAGVSSKYNEKQADKKYDNAIKTNKSKIKIGSFFYLAKNAGVELRTKEEETAYAIAKSAKRNRSNIEGAITTAIASGINPKLTEEIARKVFERNDIDLNDGDISVIEEATAFIRMNTDLKRNEIKHCIENDGMQIDDTFLNSIYLKTKIFLKDKIGKTDVDAIIHSDIIKSYNPITEWINANKDRPNEPEIIDRFISTIPYTDSRAKVFVRHWLMGLPASYHNEVVRLVLCFIGKQETGKTYFFRHMLPVSLRDYYAESSLMKEGDDAQVMGGNMIVMDDELGGKSKKDMQKFKELTSKEWFSVRLPYDRTVTKIKRMAMLCGTTNDFQVADDSTGNTRMLPVEFNEKYDFKAYNAIDKDQLLIEIFRAYDGGESWQLTPEASELLAAASTNYSVADFEMELIETFLEKPTTSYGGFLMSNTEIKIYLERCSGQKILSTRKLGIALRKVFVNEVAKIDGHTKRGYRCVTLNNYVKQIDNQEVDKVAPW
jgi:predicted P-loop ATPase